MKSDVAIIGAGIVGCAVARKLAREGASVTVIDRDEPGRQASWAAAGMLAPQAEADREDPFLSLLLRARDEFPRLAEDLRLETRMDVGYRTDGVLFVGFDEEDAAEMRRRFEWQSKAGLDIEAISGDEAREREPILSRAVTGALLVAGDHQVDNRALARALWFSAHSAGAHFLIGHAAQRLEKTGAGLQIELASGDAVGADRVVLAAGSWSGGLAGLPRAVPVEPVHGQLIALDTAPPLLRHVIVGPRGYLVPRSNGRLIVGATMERVGFRTGVTAAGLRFLADVAAEISPELADRRVVAHWSGLRPGTPDNRPILGPDPDLPELIYATGHFRNGILLGPLTGEIIGEVAMGRPSPVDLAPYRADRF